MNWQLLPQFLVTGLLTGGIYSLVALGLVLIYKSSQIFNFAQGHLLMFSAFITWSLMVQQGWPIWVAILGGATVAVLLGVLIERLALRPLIGQPILATIMMTLALSQIIQGVTILVFGGARQVFPEIFPLKPVIIPLGGDVRVVLKVALLWGFGLAMAGVAIFALFFRFTRVGLAMRAAAEDHQLAQSVGLKVRRIFAAAWAIAGVIGLVGGVIIGSISGVEPTLAGIGLKAFPAVLFGGLESIPGAIIGGLLIGVIENLVGGLPANQAIRATNPAEIAPYVILLLVLLFKPDGLFGLKRIERI
ncbi:MAG: branched-chain amino acid ABC transporter permease [Anaerolineales bacterium]|nr:MAG: branched-chain amino acid ABC transporter permease [Anaerolineales bacterium]